jgi:soluble lytic murein transglycosylase
MGGLPLLATGQPATNNATIHKGSQVITSPVVAPGDPAPLREVNLQVVQKHLETGNDELALQAAIALTSKRTTSTSRIAAYMTIGVIHRKYSRHNLASEAFTKVRTGQSPLAQWGAYYEAEQDLLRGKPAVAMKECKALLSQWPNGRFAIRCQRIIAVAAASAGQPNTGQRLAAELDAEHPDLYTSDYAALVAATSLSPLHPQKATFTLNQLRKNHSNPAVGKKADALLAELASTEEVVLPVPTTEEAQKRASSLLRSGRKEMAWDLFQDIIQSRYGPPPSEPWILQNQTRFAWGARKYTFLSDLYGQRYKATPTGEIAWSALNASWRSGQWGKVKEWLRTGEESHGDYWKWRKRSAYLANLWMLTGDYEAAVRRLEPLRKRSGSRGRQGRYLTSFSKYMNQQYEEAILGFTELIEANRGELDAYRYWRMKSALKVNNTVLAAEDAEWLTTERKRSWYTLLVKLSLADPEQVTQKRHGVWPTSVPAKIKAQTPTPTALGEIPTARLVETQDQPSLPSALHMLRWPMKSHVASQKPITNQSSSPEQLPQVPQSYIDGFWYNKQLADMAFKNLVKEHGAEWPDLQAVKMLADAGLYDISGPLMADLFDEVTKAQQDPTHLKHQRALKLPTDPVAWRPFFYTARDHFSTMRFSHILWQNTTQKELHQQAAMLAWPIAHGNLVWHHSKEYNVDPYFALAIMRAESRYDVTAISKAGAMGPMQIMPRTGYLMAALRTDTAFSVHDLHEPSVAIDFGVEFLGLLLQRFGGAFHLAAASYNGGPFAVSAWMKGTGHDMPIDEWVEHVLYPETRRYVKRVSLYYAQYLDIYESDAHGLHYPSGPYKDDPTIVDF